MLLHEKRQRGCASSRRDRVLPELLLFLSVAALITDFVVNPTRWEPLVVPVVIALPFTMVVSLRFRRGTFPAYLLEAGLLFGSTGILVSTTFSATLFVVVVSLLLLLACFATEASAVFLLRRAYILDRSTKRPQGL